MIITASYQIFTRTSNHHEYCFHFIILTHSTTILYVNLILRFLKVHQFRKDLSRNSFIAIFPKYDFLSCSVNAPYVLRLLMVER